MSVESQLEETAGYLRLKKYIHFKDGHVTKVHTKFLVHKIRFSGS